MDKRPRSIVRGAALGVALLATAAAPPLSAQDPGVSRELTLDDAIRIAHESNPTYRIQENALQPLGWQRRQAWGAFVPSLSVSNTFGYTAGGDRVFGDFTLGTQPAQYSSRYGINVSLGLSGSTFLQPGLADARADATRAEVDGASASLSDQVTRAYLDALRAVEQLEQARAEVDRTSRYVAQAEAQTAVGSATPLDVRRTETQRGQAEIQRLQAENAVMTTRLALEQVLGTDLPPDFALTTGFALFEPDFDLEALVANAMENNPILRARRSQASAARTQTRVAQTQYLPSLSLSAGWSGNVFQADDITPLVEGQLAQVAGQYQSCLQDNRIRMLLGDPPRDCSMFDVSDPGVQSSIREQVAAANDGFPFDYDAQPLSLSMTVSLPVFSGFSRQLQVEEAEVAADNAAQQVRAEELRVRADVEIGLRQLQTAQRTALLQAQVRETAAEELRLAEERFELGLGTSIEIADAQASLSQAERNEIAVIFDFHVALAALEALVGDSLRD